LFVALLIRSIQRWISEPLRSLAGTAQRIAGARNYSIRAKKVSQDEVGQLVDAFNFMVAEIELAQGEIHRYAATLESQVAERTAKLSETVSELEGFSYSVSHDMRGPLRAISGYAEVVLERLPAEDLETKDYLERMVRASQRMDHLICDILQYSRVAKSEMPVEVVDLDSLLFDVLSEYPQFSSAAFEIKGPLGGVLGHRAALSQVISNLLGNAIKFVPAGRKPEIRIWTEIKGQNRRVLIADNGIGMRQEDLCRLFKIFERVGDVRSYDGTGIGLSIVKKAVEKMRGHVGVESQLGQGSTFWFELKSASTAPKEKNV
jgi:signal transduction histidine kinase